MMEAQTRMGAARVAGVLLGVQPGQVLSPLEGQQGWTLGFSGLRHASPPEVCALEEQARTLGLDGHEVSVMRVPQTRAVRVLRDPSPVDLLLLELYLENEPRSAGGPLDGLRSLPGDLGVVGSFQQWQGESSCRARLPSPPSEP